MSRFTKQLIISTSITGVLVGAFIGVPLIKTEYQTFVENERQKQIEYRKDIENGLKEAKWKTSSNYVEGTFCENCDSVATYEPKFAFWFDINHSAQKEFCVVCGNDSQIEVIMQIQMRFYKSHYDRRLVVKEIGGEDYIHIRNYFNETE